MAKQIGINQQNFLGIFENSITKASWLTVNWFEEQKGG